MIATIPGDSLRQILLAAANLRYNGLAQIESDGGAAIITVYNATGSSYIRTTVAQEPGRCGEVVIPTTMLRKIVDAFKVYDFIQISNENSNVQFWALDSLGSDDDFGSAHVSEKMRISVTPEWKLRPQTTVDKPIAQFVMEYREFIGSLSFLNAAELDSKLIDFRAITETSPASLSIFSEDSTIATYVKYDGLYSVGESVSVAIDSAIFESLDYLFWDSVNEDSTVSLKIWPHQIVFEMGDKTYGFEEFACVGTEVKGMSWKNADSRFSEYDANHSLKTRDLETMLRHATPLTSPFYADVKLVIDTDAVRFQSMDSRISHSPIRAKITKGDPSSIGFYPSPLFKIINAIPTYARKLDDLKESVCSVTINKEGLPSTNISTSDGRYKVSMCGYPCYREVIQKNRSWP